MSIKLPDDVKKGEVEAWKGGTLLPIGWHTVTIDEATDTKSTNGHPQVEITFSSPDGDIRDWLTFVDAAMGRVVQFADAIKLDLVGLDEFPTEKLPGKSLSIFVAEEPKQDGSGNISKVKSYALAGKGGRNGSPPIEGGAADDDLPF